MGDAGTALFYRAADASSDIRFWGDAPPTAEMDRNNADLMEAAIDVQDSGFLASFDEASSRLQSEGDTLLWELRNPCQACLWKRIKKMCLDAATEATDMLCASICPCFTCIVKCLCNFHDALSEEAIERRMRPIRDRMLVRIGMAFDLAVTPEVKMVCLDKVWQRCVLEVIQGPHVGTIFELEFGSENDHTQTIGSDASVCDVVLDRDGDISSEHALIVSNGDELYFSDIDSDQGMSKLQDVEAEADMLYELKEGFVISLGTKTKLVFHALKPTSARPSRTKGCCCELVFSTEHWARQRWLREQLSKANARDRATAVATAATGAGASTSATAPTPASGP